MLQFLVQIYRSFPHSRDTFGEFPSNMIHSVMDSVNTIRSAKYPAKSGWNVIMHHRRLTHVSHRNVFRLINGFESNLSTCCCILWLNMTTLRANVSIPRTHWLLTDTIKADVVNNVTYCRDIWGFSRTRSVAQNGIKHLPWPHNTHAWVIFRWPNALKVDGPL